MPTIDPAELSKADRYRLIINSVVPRPIAWITTIDTDGVSNLAPFSYFMGVTSSPPTVAVSIGARSPVKDTLANLRANGQAVIHLVPAEHIDTVNRTGAEYPQGTSEIEALGLPTLPSDLVAPPRLAFADVALEVRLFDQKHIGSPGATLVILEVLRAHVADQVAREDGLPDPEKLRAVARLGERAYLAGDGWNIETRPKPSID